MHVVFGDFILTEIIAYQMKEITIRCMYLSRKFCIGYMNSFYVRVQLFIWVNFMFNSNIYPVGISGSLNTRSQAKQCEKSTTSILSTGLQAGTSLRRHIHTRKYIGKRVEIV